MGNHTWDNRDIFEFIHDAKKMIRPANFPEGTTPGTGMTFVKVNSHELAVINLHGRTFMSDVDDPFRKADELIKQAQERTNKIFVDFHAETTSEKQAMAWYLRRKSFCCCGNTYSRTNQRCTNLTTRHCLSNRCWDDWTL